MSSGKSDAAKSDVTEVVGWADATAGGWAVAAGWAETEVADGWAATDSAGASAEGAASLSLLQPAMTTAAIATTEMNRSIRSLKEWLGSARASYSHLK